MIKRCPWCGKTEKRITLHPTGSPFLAKCSHCGQLYGQNNQGIRMIVPGALTLLFLFLCLLHPLFFFPMTGALLYLMTNMFRLPYEKKIRDHLTDRYRFVKFSPVMFRARFEAGQGRLPFQARGVYPTTAHFDAYACFTQRSPVQIVRMKKDGTFVFQNLYAHDDNPPYEEGDCGEIYFNEQPYRMKIIGK